MSSLSVMIRYCRKYWNIFGEKKWQSTGLPRENWLASCLASIQGISQVLTPCPLSWTINEWMQIVSDFALELTQAVSSLQTFTQRLESYMSGVLTVCYSEHFLLHYRSPEHLRAFTPGLSYQSWLSITVHRQWRISLASLPSYSWLTRSWRAESSISRSCHWAMTVKHK